MTDEAAPSILAFEDLTQFLEDLAVGIATSRPGALMRNCRPLVPCSCCGTRRPDVDFVSVEPLHPGTDPVKVEKLALFGTCLESKSRAWRLRWRPSPPETCA